MEFCSLITVYSKDNSVFFERALSSIWNDQSLRPNQIVLVQDGPIPLELNEIINSWVSYLGSEILTVVVLKENLGLACALNEGLKYCKYDLVTRMDADDIAVPNRFDKQVKFMLDNPDIAASSGVIEEFIDLDSIISKRILPLTHEDIVLFAKTRSPLSHPAVIFRKKVIESVGGYPLFRNAQDYALWSLLIVRGHRLANLPVTLVKMRSGSEMMNRRSYSYFKRELKLLRYQREIGFLSLHEYFVNIISRAVLRLSPTIIKVWLYKTVR